MDLQPSSSGNGMHTRQKRVLPTRSRRGVPGVAGVGSCDVDLMILDTHKRRLTIGLHLRAAENEPLIPAETQFILTTNSAWVDNLSTTAQLSFNIQANERYFDRPEVLKSFREQTLIETPSFINVAELPSAGVGGRFRPRGSGDNFVDTSDAAYEKRHRKYEAFEKRLRLREKEKLKHEQYKLRERIDQLKAMDSSAFLSLAASTFSPADTEVFDSQDAILDGPTNGYGPHANNVATPNEGERRRKEMLDVASALEERYRILLPPERLRKANSTTWTGPYSRQYEENEEVSETEEVAVRATTPVKDGSKIKLKFKLPSRSKVTSPVPSQTPVRKARSVAPLPKPSSLRHTRASSHYQMEQSPSMEQPISSITSSDIHVIGKDPIVHTVEKMETPEVGLVSPQPTTSAAGTSAQPASVPATPMSNPDIAVIESTPSPGVIIVQDDELNMLDEIPPPVSANRAPKRRKTSTPPAPSEQTAESMASSPLVTLTAPPMRQTSVPPIESITSSGTAPIFVRIKQQKQKPLTSVRRGNQQLASKLHGSGKPDRSECMLMVAAIRSSAGTKSRNTMRHITAFGGKVPQEIEEYKDFQLPTWFWEEVRDGGCSDEEDEDVDDGGDGDDSEEVEIGMLDVVNIAPAGVVALGSSDASRDKRLPRSASLLRPTISSGEFVFEPPIETQDIPESCIREGHVA
ncbi:hypothetical protein AMATHDRAFT_46394 [Amanita thiersii Skay4041]|uniref:PEHE domain-containing protein n=1 Tax=Amanita thiersii Skay4041 TaxID=703135 RepID=A0A2A9NMQ4_9AGAR|nr:hypothetical protein AMATHDRAFT_46394 [Amanita thiersii Skay4041]